MNWQIANSFKRFFSKILSVTASYFKLIFSNQIFDSIDFWVREHFNFKKFEKKIGLLYVNEERQLDLG